MTSRGQFSRVVDNVEAAAEHLRRSVTGLRKQGQVALLPHALMGLAWICYLLGAFAEGRACIGECMGSRST